MASLINDTRAYVSAGSTKTLVDGDCGLSINLDALAGSVVTLPAATGSGKSYRFIVTVLATSNSHIVKVANATDTMQGIVYMLDDTGAAVVGFAAGATSDTITLNRSTTGSVSLGEWLELEDIAAGKWQVRGFLSNTGASATPFSATV